MKFARFDIDRPPGPDTVTLRAKLKGAQGFAKQVELLVLSASAPREAVDRFLQGGARLAELADGNLLQVLEVGHEQGRAFLATEASAGEPLSKLLEKCKERGLESMPAPIALGIGAELAKALAHAHAHSDSNNNPDPVTHGALRSEAITVGEDGAVKLGGFVPWRAAPSVEDDLEKLVELVSSWVTAGDRKLVRESAGGLTAAGDLRKAWSAYQALQWPGLAPDARRTWVSFAKGEATKLTLESKLGARPTKVAVPKWGFAVGGVAVLLVAVALLWPSDEPAKAEAVALPPRKKPPPKVEETRPDPSYVREVEVDGAQHHLVLPADLPGISSSQTLGFSEFINDDGEAPQLFVAETKGTGRLIATVPASTWSIPGATELRFFSWEPFEGRYRSPGLRSLILRSTTQRLLPLVQQWLEVEAAGIHLEHVPPNKSLVVSVGTSDDGGTPRGPLLVAVSYGQSAPSADDKRWPHQLTRLVLEPGETSPTLNNPQELAFIAVEPADRFRITVKEGANSRENLWPSTHQPSEVSVPVTFEGHYDGYQTPLAVQLISKCARGTSLDRACRESCISRFSKSYICWRYYTEGSGLHEEQARGAKTFLQLVQSKNLDHPFITTAERIAGVAAPMKDLDP